MSKRQTKGMSLISMLNLLEPYWWLNIHAFILVTAFVVLT